jgi:hypothetical protein
MLSCTNKIDKLEGHCPACFSNLHGSGGTQMAKVLDSVGDLGVKLDKLTLVVEEMLKEKIDDGKTDGHLAEAKPGVHGDTEGSTSKELNTKDSDKIGGLGLKMDMQIATTGCEKFNADIKTVNNWAKGGVRDKAEGSAENQKSGTNDSDKTPEIDLSVSMKFGKNFEKLKAGIKRVNHNWHQLTAKTEADVLAGNLDQNALAANEQLHTLEKAWEAAVEREFKQAEEDMASIDIRMVGSSV